MPTWSWKNIQAIMPTVGTVTVIGIVESIGIAKALELKNKDTKVLPNQELFALGISKALGSFFQAIPSSASFTRSAVNNESGAKTGLSSVIAAAATGLVLLFFTPLFYYLPKAVLAAIVLMAVRSLFELKGAKELWTTHRNDFFMMLITFLMTLLLGIEEGVLTGVILSLLLVIYQSSRPHFAVLGRLPNTNYFRNVKRFPEAQQFDGILIFRFDAPLFFLNTESFKNAILRAVDSASPTCKLVVFDASSVLDIDSGGLHAIEEIDEYLNEQGITFYVAGLLGPVRDAFQRAGLFTQLGQQKHFLYVSDAIDYYKTSDQEQDAHWTKRAIQHNLKTK